MEKGHGVLAKPGKRKTRQKTLDEEETSEADEAAASALYDISTGIWSQVVECMKNNGELVRLPSIHLHQSS
jgi:hypothetical protein